MQFQLDNMTCGGCARVVTTAIKAVDPGADVVADPSARQIKIQTSASKEKIVTALREAGFPPR